MSAAGKAACCGWGGPLWGFPSAPPTPFHLALHPLTRWVWGGVEASERPHAYGAGVEQARPPRPKGRESRPKERDVRADLRQGRHEDSKGAEEPWQRSTGRHGQDSEAAPRQVRRQSSVPHRPHPCC